MSNVASHATLVAAMYSASADDRATVVCFFDAHDIALLPRRNTYPLVLFLSSVLPATKKIILMLTNHFPTFQGNLKKGKEEHKERKREKAFTDFLFLKPKNYDSSPSFVNMTEKEKEVFKNKSFILLVFYLDQLPCRT